MKHTSKIVRARRGYDCLICEGRIPAGTHCKYTEMKIVRGHGVNIALYTFYSYTHLECSNPV